MAKTLDLCIFEQFTRDHSERVNQGTYLYHNSFRSFLFSPLTAGLCSDGLQSQLCTLVIVRPVKQPEYEAHFEISRFKLHAR